MWDISVELAKRHKRPSLKEWNSYVLSLYLGIIHSQLMYKVWPVRPWGVHLVVRSTPSTHTVVSPKLRPSAAAANRLHHYLGISSQAMFEIIAQMCCGMVELSTRLSPPLLVATHTSYYHHICPYLVIYKYIFWFSVTCQWPVKFDYTGHCDCSPLPPWSRLTNFPCTSQQFLGSLRDTSNSITPWSSPGWHTTLQCTHGGVLPRMQKFGLYWCLLTYPFSP